MTYCALARRATGLFYYCFRSGSWNIRQHPEVWTALTRVVAEVNERRPLFQAEHVWWPYVHEFPGSLSGFNQALESSITPCLLRVKLGNSSVAVGKYLLAVNNTDRQFRYRITLPPLVNEHVLALDENRRLPIVDGWLEDEFAPYAVHVYGPWQRAKRGSGPRSQVSGGVRGPTIRCSFYRDELGTVSPCVPSLARAWSSFSRSSISPASQLLLARQMSLRWRGAGASPWIALMKG